MSRLVKLTALLLAALWLPATLHCQLEGLGADEILCCADHPSESPPADNCMGDGCQVFESGLIALSKPGIEYALPSLTDSVCTHCCPSVTLPVIEPEIFATRQNVALPLQRTWQFTRRAALPARAPDALNAARA